MVISTNFKLYGFPTKFNIPITPRNANPYKTPTFPHPNNERTCHHSHSVIAPAFQFAPILFISSANRRLSIFFPPCPVTGLWSSGS